VSDDRSQPDDPRWRLLLRRVDQACVSVVIVLSLLVMAAYWVAWGGNRGRLIDIDHVQPRPVQFQVDINSADWPELTLLPGIGESLARRIVEFRGAHGTFARHDDLRRVKGIGPKTLEQIRPYLAPVQDVGPAPDFAARTGKPS
jgi:competence protein ComEA